MSDKEKSNLLKILLVEKDTDVAKRINDMVAGWGEPACQIHTATALADGLQATSAWKFDLVFLNLFLPDSAGLETLQKIQEVIPQVPVIVLDESDDFERAAGAAGMGAHDYFPTDRIEAADFKAAVLVALANHKKELALIRSEKKFRTIVETLEDAYYETDLDHRIIYANNTFCKHLQRPMEEVIGLQRMECSTPEAARQLTQVLKDVFLTGASQGIVDDELICKDGSRVEAELSIMLMRDPAGHPIGYSYISRDVTEKKNAERALKVSEEKYRNILASIEDGYFETDLRGKITFCNDAQAKILGYAKEELVGMSNRDVMDAKNANKVYRAYNKIFKTGKSNRSLQCEIIRKDGVKRVTESSVSLIKDDKDQPVGFRGLARDITERKQAERELMRAKAQAEEATLAKSDFLANMSHEIRTPLNGIIGMYNLLLTTTLASEQADFVETGKRSAESLLAVINDILDFSKIEAGQLDIEIIDFDLRKAVQEIMALPAMQAHAKGLELIYRIEPDVPSFLMGDPGRLRQIIMNLCTNAIKFTKKGEVVISVTKLEEDDGQVKLRFAVRDSGIGISKPDQARLFQSFQQVDASTTRKYGGTGLGLAISKKLTEMMGGEMGVDSELHQGATFWFTALFKKQSDAQERAFLVPQSLQSKRILIVDDNLTNLDILAGYLKFWNCDCDRATGGAMALTLLKAVAKTGAPYDLVISDMVMPEMDGAELGRRIKADAELKGTILIMLTSQGLRGDAAEMKRIGFAAYLTKPVRRSQLFDCLISVINPGQRGLPAGKLVQAEESCTPRPETPVSRVIHILLAEDNLINQKLALHLLDKFGFKAEAVINGRQAVEALEKKSYDLVLMDIQMPEMDGFEATAAIRDPNSAVLNHAIPVIALTAHAMKGDREKCLGAGMNDYVAKPIQPEVLRKAIEQALGRQDQESGGKDLSAGLLN